MDASKFHLITNNTITSFDYSSLQSYGGCLTDVGKVLFKNGDQWKDRSTLFEAVKCFSAYVGFAPYLTQEYIRCNRFGMMKNRDSRTQLDQK